MVTNSQNSSAVPILYGPSGQPINRLTEHENLETLFGSYDDYQAYSFILPPFNPDLWISSKGFHTLDEMMSYTAIRAPLNTLRDAIVYKGVHVQPAVNDEVGNGKDFKFAAEIRDGFEWCLNDIRDEADNYQDPRQAIHEIAYAIHTGFHVAEINWRYIDEGPYKGKLGFSSLAHKNCKQIGFDVDKSTMGVRNITSYTPLTGYRFNLPVEKVIRYTYGPRAGLPYGNGIGRSAYKHGWTIDFLYKFWNIALEMFGTPFILGKAAPNAMALARKTLQQIRQGAPPVLPQGVEADLIEIAGNGVLGFKAAIEHHTQSAAYVYLGSTLTGGTSQGGTNTNALGQVHQTQQDYGFGGRRTDIEVVLTQQLARRWVRYNYGRQFEYLTPRVSLGDWDATDTAKMAAAVKSMVEVKVLHPAEPQIREKLGFGPAKPEDRTRLETEWNASPGPIVVNSDDPPEPDDTKDGGEGTE